MGWSCARIWLMSPIGLTTNPIWLWFDSSIFGISTEIDRYNLTWTAWEPDRTAIQLVKFRLRLQFNFVAWYWIKWEVCVSGFQRVRLYSNGKKFCSPLVVSSSLTLAKEVIFRGNMVFTAIIPRLHSMRLLNSWEHLAFKVNTSSFTQSLAF